MNCVDCKCELPNAHGNRRRCGPCAYEHGRQVDKARYEAKKESIIGQVREWRKTHPDKVRVYNATYREKRKVTST